MKYKFLLSRILFLIFLSLNFIESKAKISSQVFIVMKVDNKIITNLNIEKEYRYLIALNNDLKSINKKEGLTIAKESYLREKIKENELLKYFTFDKNNPQLEQTLVKLYTDLKLKNKDEFKNYLSKFNLTIEDIKKKVEVEILWNNLIYEKFNSQVYVDIEKIKKKLKKNKIQKNYLLSEIFFDLEDGLKFKDKYALVKQSISDVGFKNTANIYSISDTAKLGGTIGWLPENQLSDVIIENINKLNIGESSKPINISGGFLILKLEKVENKKITLDFQTELNKSILFEKNKQLNQHSLIYYNKIKFNTKIDEK